MFALFVDVECQQLGLLEIPRIDSVNSTNFMSVDLIIIELEIKITLAKRDTSSHYSAYFHTVCEGKLSRWSPEVHLQILLFDTLVLVWIFF